MTFLEAVVAISKRKDMELCSSEDERNGLHPSICVYRITRLETGERFGEWASQEFVGKLRWPDASLKVPASVDDAVVRVLEE